MYTRLWRERLVSSALKSPSCRVRCCRWFPEQLRSSDVTRASSSYIVYNLDEEGRQAGVKPAVALLTFVVDNTYGAWGRGRLQVVCITGWILTSRAQPVVFPPSRSHPLLKRLHIRNENGCSVNDADATKALGVAETSQPTQMR